MLLLGNNLNSNLLVIMDKKIIHILKFQMRIDSLVMFNKMYHHWKILLIYLMIQIMLKIWHINLICYTTIIRFLLIVN